LFCPKCADEFQFGIAICPDCRVSLVERLEPERSSASFVQVLVTTDELKLGVVKGFLRSRGIPFRTISDPAEPFGFSDPGEMQLLVPPEYAESVRMEIAKREREGADV
jgi:hypothetical protein